MRALAAPDTRYGSRTARIYTDNFYPCDGGSACELALAVRYFNPQAV